MQHERQSTQALILQPEAAQVCYDRVLVNAISEADLEQATEDLDRALEDIESALTDLTVAIEFADDHSDITLSGATYTIHEVLQLLSGLGPDESYYWLYLGYAYSEGGYFEEAIEPYTNAIAMDRSMVEAYQLRGLCWIEMEMVKQAVDDLQKVLEITDDPAVIETVSEFLNQIQE